MKNILIFIGFFILISNISYAQIKIGTDIGLAFPKQSSQSGLKNFYSLGGNINLSLGYLINDKFELGLASGYYYFKDNVPSFEATQNIIPVELFLKYKFYEKKIIPYMGIASGAFFISQTSHSDPSLLNFSSANFGISYIVGIYHSLNDKWQVGANVKYSFIFREFEDMRFLNPNLGIFYTFK